MKTIRVSICGHSLLFREGVKSILQVSPFEVVRTACSLAEIVEEPDDSAAADIVIWGVDQDERFEQEVAPFADSFPTETKLVVVAGSPSAELVRAAAAVRVRAILTTDISGTVLQRTLELVMLGQQVFPAPGADAQRSRPGEHIKLVCSQTPAAAVEPFARSLPRLRLASTGPHDEVQLSDREVQILRCLVEGAPNKTIARDLDIADATVKVHIKGLLRKLRVNNRTQAAVWGMNNGYADGVRRGLGKLGEAEPVLRAVP